MRHLLPRSLEVEAARSIRSSILNGELRSGDHLKEVELAEELSISRGTIRAALQELRREGLVEYRPNRGIFVSSFGSTDAWEIYTLRDSLEGLAARMAASQLTEVGRVELSNIRTRLIRAVEQGDRSRTAKLDFELHQLIVRLAQHSRLEQIYEALNTQIIAFMRLTEDLHPDLEDFLAIHLPLIDAILAENAARAGQLAETGNIPDGEALRSMFEAHESATDRGHKTRRRAKRDPRGQAARS